jgi:phage N-6-adenine-methyltransferase
MGFKEDRTENSRDDWETPPDLFNKLNMVFDFDIDVCATAENTKCQKYYTPEIDGLKQPWHNHKTCWCNPPYGREIKKWLEKALKESKLGTTVVCLITARPGTHYWHDIIFQYARAICFIKGRLRFVGAEEDAKFPSALVVFSPNPLEPQQLKTLSWHGQLIVGGLKVRCV